MCKNTNCDDSYWAKAKVHYHCPLTTQEATHSNHDDTHPYTSQCGCLLTFWLAIQILESYHLMDIVKKCVCSNLPLLIEIQTKHVYMYKTTGVCERNTYNL